MDKKILYIFIFGIILISFVSTALSLNINNNQINNDNDNLEEFASNECQICELVVKDVIDCLTSNMSIHEIEIGVDLLCFRVMPFHSKPCRNFINSNIEKIVQIIEDNGDPNEVCSKIGACSSSENLEIKNNINQNNHYNEKNYHQINK
ncbi:hypothetical protein DICPUDRAFT_92325 [Dictyostelium purpureum]|uniref:Saposin B-type domain-containing protein n=1 Tax=Dictyostelium purpureum TaxID=5786 RepID=F0ZQ86_DICPU|nr:uncharacterized protein DICPUDRAFT_92325 [Dictyostelium purpureum]EGC33900.1 hypothetical protein DICPUDRAFT_92325 [Dictyostelium purpureum]|eukprot:XP_003289583.1 hypothetical protein DICPUDRAFT_92325 [Dictyostelium purpureum]